MRSILKYDQFINEKKSSPALKPGKITTDEDGENKVDKESAESKLAKKSKKIDKEADADKKKTKTSPDHSGSGASSGDSDVRSPTSTEVRSPTSTRTEVRSPTSTETSTDAYTSGNVTVTGGAGAGDTTVNIESEPEKYKRLPSGRGRKKHMPSAIAMEGPNDKKSY